MQQKAETEDTIMWLPVAAGGEKEITSAPPHTGDSKGGGKKGLHQLKYCKELWTERIHRGSVLSASHRKEQEREPAKSHHCYGDLKRWTHSARRRDKSHISSCTEHPWDRIRPQDPPSSIVSWCCHLPPHPPHCLQVKEDTAPDTNVKGLFYYWFRG